MRSALTMILLGSMLSHCAYADVDALLSDAKLYVTAPLRWDQHDWWFAGGAVAAIAAAHHYDDSVRDHYALGKADKNDSHSSGDALPAAAVVAGTWVMAWLWDDRAGYREAHDMLEAAAFSGISTLVLKQVVRRDRPDSTDSNAWFKGGDSFPSLHVSAAMAIGAVLAESGGDDYRWLRRGLGYGLGAATGYLRVRHQQHWLSDTVASAALGISTARFVLNRHRPPTALSSLQLLPTDGGLMLSYAATF